MKMNTACLILAAGSSSRLGRPKQLLKHKQETLIEKAISTVLAANISQVYVVLGSDFEIVRNTISHLPVHVIHHQAWQEGIGSSIRKGINFIEKGNYVDAILIMLCDQPRINSDHLNALIQSYSKQNKSIIATGYGQHAGVPALFDRKIFPFLKELKGDSGAKSIINKNSKDVFVVNFEQAGIDIDTPEDLRNLE
jgi:molybdenum cofactor cytidylyltransferase